jgi:hypothetical protein
MNEPSEQIFEEDALGRRREPGKPAARPAPGKSTLTARLGARAPRARDIAAEIATLERSNPGGPQRNESDGLTASAPVELAAVQLDASPSDAHEDPFAIHLLARDGVASGGGRLPHHDAIQRSFGHHDLSGVRAHVGGAATEASAAMGARAYATGDDVAFAASPDLHLAAHEAAHVVQQRGGVRLEGGVGRIGDPYEQHADAVADLVVRGDSAQGLLDTMAHRGASGGPAATGDPAVQGDFSVRELSAARDAMVNDVAMEQIAHRIAYLDGRLPASAPRAAAPAATPATPAPAASSSAAHRREALRHADVDALDHDALAALGFDVDHFQFFSGANGLQFWILPTRADSPRPGIIAFRGTEADGPIDEAIQDLTEDATEAGVGMSQFAAPLRCTSSQPAAPWSPPATAWAVRSRRSPPASTLS